MFWLHLLKRWMSKLESQTSISNSSPISQASYKMNLRCQCLEVRHVIVSNVQMCSSSMWTPCFTNVALSPFWGCVEGGKTLILFGRSGTRRQHSAMFCSAALAGHSCRAVRDREEDRWLGPPLLLSALSAPEKMFTSAPPHYARRHDVTG